jgi:hypothetical protein
VSAGPEARCELVVEPDPVRASTARAFAAAVARGADMDEARTEDLKILLTEIVASAAESATGRPLVIELRPLPSGMSVRCDPAGAPSSGARDRLMRALAPGLEWTPSGTVSFTL